MHLYSLSPFKLLRADGAIPARQAVPQRAQLLQVQPHGRVLAPEIGDVQLGEGEGSLAMMETDRNIWTSLVADAA